MIGLFSFAVSSGFCCDLSTVGRAWEKIESTSDEETDISSIIQNARSYLKICDPIIQDKECFKTSALKDDLKLAELSNLITFCENSRRLLKEL